jgi:GGDEF domain-containing protein
VNVNVDPGSADGTRVDRHALSGALLAIAALAGAIAVALGAPTALAVAAGAAGAAAGALAIAVSSRAQVAEERARSAVLEVDVLRRQVRMAEDARDDAESRLEWRASMTTLRRATQVDRLTDDETGLLNEAWLVVAVDSRIAAARRNLRPVAIVVVDVVVGLDGDRPAPADPRRVATAIIETIREADEAFRLHDGTYALLLEDTTDSGATWTAERVRLAVSSMEPGAVMWAGVSCYPSHGLTTDEVLDRAHHALDSAREWRQHRIEVATTTEL